jgi:peptide chain release factor 2
MGAVGFWNNPEAAQKTVREIKTLKNLVEPWEDVSRNLADTAELAELMEGDRDASAERELAAEVERLEEAVERLRLEALLSDPNDSLNALLKVQSGTGGADCHEWTEMLLRMYLRWAEGRGYKTEILDQVAGSEGGFLHAQIRVEGPMAFGWLKGERGIHRLVRISPFSGKRETSFAGVEVMPEHEEEDAVEIPDSEIRVDRYRASGAGGQHVNVTDSAVRLTHLPTGLVVTCQNERSQHRNYATAMKLLKAKLAMQREIERDAKLRELYSNKGEIDFGRRDRNYFLHPETRVVDERSGYKSGNVQAVLDGELDPLMEAYLRWKAGAGA